MRVIIASGRDFNDYELLCSSCDRILKNLFVTEIVQGGAAGADALGKRFAEERNYAVREFSAEWGRYGRRAGPIRNRQIAEYSDMLICL